MITIIAFFLSVFFPSMPSKTIEKYVVCDKQFIEWDKFVGENEWLNNQTTIDKAPKNIVAEYYIVNKGDKTLLDKAYVVSWLSEYKAVFKELNLAWIEKLFKPEPMDYVQLDSAEENIINHGGEVFFVTNREGEVVGTVAMVLHDGKCELAKMSVKENYHGKGYSHYLMRTAIAWAKKQKCSTVDIFGNTILESSISLYKKYGFKTVSIGPHHTYDRVNIHMRWEYQ
ncbi:unnamed protein product [Rhizopus stolonifer]